MNQRPVLARFSAYVVLIVLVALARADETVLYEKVSAYNRIVVTEENGLRILRFGRNGVRQSAVKPGNPDFLALPYAQVVLVGLALSAESRRFLVVGLGGGTLPMFLRKYYPNATIDAVDIDPDVIDVARRFFGFREDVRMQAHVRDGRQFIEELRQPYDVIFLDAFGPDSIPERLTTQEFLQAVRRAVTPGGIVVGNIWGRSANPLYDSMVRTYQAVFEELVVLNVREASNKILLALPRKQPLTRDDVLQLARKLSAAKRFPFDLAVPVQFGFRNAPAKTQHERVLRDRDLVPKKRDNAPLPARNHSP